MSTSGEREASQEETRIFGCDVGDRRAGGLSELVKSELFYSERVSLEMEERTLRSIPSIGEKALKAHDILSSLRFPNLASPGNMVTPWSVISMQEFDEVR